MRKILYISGTRADYGLMRHTLFAIYNHPNLALEIAATGMHLMPEFGETIDEIRDDTFPLHEIPAMFSGDDKESMSRFIGEFIATLTDRIKKIKPNMLLLQGDRVEMLGGAIVGAYLGIPVAHSHGGDVSSTVDETVRHAITKLSHIHFAATKNSAKRIIKMGEDPWRVFVIGAPGLDSILQEPLIPQKEMAARYSLDISKPILLVIQHPVSEETKEAPEQMRKTMEAIQELGYQSIVVYPNADAGGRGMIEVIETYRNYPFIKMYKNIPHKEYVSLMRIASVMIGNSSSGIIEAPSFHLPVVNIGTRQERRERAGNTIEVGYDKKEIKRAVQKALLDRSFIQKVKKSKSPYGDGTAAKKIADVLSKIPLDAQLLKKQITY